MPIASALCRPNSSEVCFLHPLTLSSAKHPSVQITDSQHPGCYIRQLIAGPITDDPKRSLRRGEATHNNRSDGLAPLSGVTEGGRFAYRPSSINGGTVTGSDGDDTPLDNDADVPYFSTSMDTPEGTATASTAANRNAGNSTTPTANPTQQQQQQRAETEFVTQQQAPGWDNATAATNADRVLDMSAAKMTIKQRQQAAPVSTAAEGERSYLEAVLHAGHSPSTAIAAGYDPAASARGLQASVVAEAVRVEFVGATVVLGPVVGRVTQGSAVVLVEAGSPAPVACVLTDGVTGGQHRQVRLLCTRSLMRTASPGRSCIHRTACTKIDCSTSWWRFYLRSGPTIIHQGCRADRAHVGK